MALSQEEIKRILNQQSVVDKIIQENRPKVTSQPRNIVLGTYADILQPLTNNYAGDMVFGNLQRGLNAASYGDPVTYGKNLQTGGINPAYRDIGVDLLLGGAARKPALQIAEELTPWTITQEFIPGTKDQIKGVKGGLDVALSDAQKMAYTQDIMSRINKIPGEVSGSRWTGAGWWDGISNPLIGIDIRAPKSQVESIMAGLGRGSSQAAEAANRKIPFGGLLGKEINAVEINFGKPATAKQMQSIADSLPSGVGVATSKKGARIFNEGWNADITKKDVFSAGENAAKITGGKAKKYAGETMYYENPQYADIAQNNPYLAEEIRRQTAEAAMRANANVIKENPLQRFGYSPVEEILRKTKFQR